MVETVASLPPPRDAREEAMLAWYFAELGAVDKAIMLMGRASGEGASGDPLASTVLLLARNCLERESGSGAGPESWHLPEGDGGRYRFQVKARLPLNPVEGERVLLRAHFGSAQASRPAAVVVDSGGSRREIPMRVVAADGVESYREAAIGSFGSGESVSYRFVFDSAEGRLEGPSFSFDIGLREAVSSALALGDGQFRLRTRSRPDGTAYARVARTAGGIGLFVSGSPISADTYPSSSEAEDDLAIDLGPDASLRFRSGGAVLTGGFSGLGLSPLELDLDAEGRVMRCTLRLRASAGESFYGAGERYASVAHEGRSLDSYVFNQYCGQADRSYLPIPFYSSSCGYGLRLVSGGYARMGFDSCPRGYVELELESGGRGAPIGATFYAGSPREALAGYLADVGMPALPPRWAFGPWMSSNNWDSQALSLEQVRLTRDLGIPATVIVLEQWSDEATFYIWNDAFYERRPGSEAFRLADFKFPAEGRWPDPKAMVDEMHSAGLRVLLWQAPVMKYMDGIPHAQRDEDERHMIASGYCLSVEGGAPYRIPDFEWFKRSSVPDFSNPAARAWWLSKRRYLVEEIGIDGIKTDGGECIYGRGVRDASGRRGEELRNAYPVEYEGAFHRWLREEKGGDAMTFSRAGFEGAQAYPAHWAGDEKSTFEAFRASIRAGLSAGLSGLSFWSWDFAGFSGDVPSAELFLRAAAMAALCPIMQYHAESKGERCRDRTPWNIAERSDDPLVVDAYRALARLRMNILPYLWAEAKRSAATGEPMMRALFAEYPREAYLRGVDDEYFLGPSLLVAPIVREGQSSRDALLPPGLWSPLLGPGPVLEGGRIVSLDSPVGGIPAFLREDSMIALNLPESLDFPGDVGNGVDAYRRLCFLIHAREGFEEEYERYDGMTVSLRVGEREGRGFGVEVENGGREAVWLAQASARTRAWVKAEPGRATLELGS
jgi:alpha-glucosidase (family GH31 glycosyl hydrolase)